MLKEFSTANNLIYDNLGRVTFFHGFNLVYKGFPWYPETMLNEDQVQALADSGVNSVRLGFMWSGAQPEEGKFNMTYYGIMKGIVKNLESKGIYTYLDMHQDVLSSLFCEYDGAPLWVVKKMATPEHAFPWPLPGDCSTRGWGSNYLSQATGVAFDGLYHNHNGMRDDMVAFWKFTAEYFKDTTLIGYEMINEPWPGDIYTNPDLLLPGHAGSKSLQPFYDIISSEIRSVDPNHIIMYEPVTWGMIFNGSVIGSGFTAVPGGAEWAHKSIFSFHYYCWWLDASDPAADKYVKTCDHMFGPKVFNQVKRELSQLGGAALLTEWGQGCGDQRGKIVISDPSTFSECNAIMDLADSHLTGWTDWYFGAGPLTSGPWVDAEDPIWTVYGRPYARAVAGDKIDMGFDWNTLTYSLCFTPSDYRNNNNNLSKDDAHVTEVFINSKRIYPQGSSMKVTGDIEIKSVDNEKGVVYLVPKSGRNKKFGKSCFTVSPASV